MAAGDVEVSIDNNSGKKAVIFNNSSSYLENTSFPKDLSKSFSICLSVIVGDISDDHRLFEKGSNNDLRIIWTTNKLICSTGDGSGNSVSSSTLNQGDKKRICITYDGTDLKLFENGSSQDSTTHGNFPTNSTKITIGNYGGSKAFGFGGAIGDIIIYEKALTTSEVSDDYKGKITYSKNPIAQYKFKSDYTDDIGGNDFTNSNTYITFAESEIANSFKSKRVTANDHYLITGLKSGQVVSTSIEEAP